MSKFGTQLRLLRKAKGLSQLDLALAAEVSSKHISFLETGRANPSQALVLRLAQILRLPLRHQNELLSLAGFANQFARTPLDQKGMQHLLSKLNLILTKQDPYPATVLDWHWNIISANRGFHWLLAQAQQLNPNLAVETNIAKAAFNPNCLRPFLVNWDEIAGVILERLYLEERDSQGRHAQLIKELKQYPDIPEHWFKPNVVVSSEPFIYMDVRFGSMELKFLTTATAFGTAIDITAAEIMIENYYPANDQTQQIFDSLVLE